MKYLLYIVALAPYFVMAAESPYKPPVLAATAIIEIYDQSEFKGIVLIDRGKAPFGKAIPGGKVEYGETVGKSFKNTSCRR